MIVTITCVTINIIYELSKVKSSKPTWHLSDSCHGVLLNSANYHAPFSGYWLLLAVFSNNILTRHYNFILFRCSDCHISTGAAGFVILYQSAGVEALLSATGCDNVSSLRQIKSSMFLVREEAKPDMTFRLVNILVGIVCIYSLVGQNERNTFLMGRH